MKRFFLVLLAALLVCLCACGEKGDAPMINPEIPEIVQPRCNLVVKIGETWFYPFVEDNASVTALFEKLSSDALTLSMHDYGGFEKVAALPWELPTSDAEITATAGDIVLYQGNTLSLIYGENTWNYTKLAHIDATSEAFSEALVDGDVTVTLWLEWTE